MNEFNNFYKRRYKPIPKELDGLGRIIVDSAYTVHKKLGPGLLERIYEVCFCHELEKRKICFKRQIDIPIEYDDIIFNAGIRLDVFVEEKIICELKSVETVNPIWEAQLLSQLKLANKRLGYLINFNVTNIGQGIRRFVL
jgi:GxxExxY protein